MIVRDAIPAFLSIVAVAVVVYIATWSGWFLTDGWDRNWAEQLPIVDSRAAARPLALLRKHGTFTQSGR